jgi:DNA invertase Pin-like site-specific DNA recombinase
MGHEPLKVKPIRAIGYVRVSTEMQAQEGVSLEAQKLRIAAHCTAMDITLVDIVTDAGASAKSLERPGIQAALKMLKQGKADAIVVMKLDRLTRSVKDLGYLCESYFGDGRPWSLLSVSDAIDTRSASGKLVLNVLTSVAQWEREAIADRVREAMQHMKSQGVFLGAAPYGWQYIDELDEHGRCKLVENPEEQAGIKRICELYDSDLFVWQICEKLEAEKIPPRGPRWHRATVYRVLRRAGYEDPTWKPKKQRPSRKPRSGQRIREVIRDKGITAERARALRGQGLSLRQIAEQLKSENYLPPRANLWHAASVLDLLRVRGTTVKKPSSRD